MDVPAGGGGVDDGVLRTIELGRVGSSGTGARLGGHEANIEAFTETQWVTMQGDIATYPF